ncbi:MAG: DUF3861 family protein [Muribaculaceae bacterium]|nr:DUF3861 family protein [Muribaculaceae bacterium]
MDKEKRSYHFNVTEVVDGKIQEVMNFNFGGHHDLAALVEKVVETGEFKEKHVKELVVGVRLLHHVLKKYPDNQIFMDFAPYFKAFKDKLKEQVKK